MRKILIIDDHPIVLAIMAAIAQNIFPDACIAALGCLGGSLNFGATSNQGQTGLGGW